MNEVLDGVSIGDLGDCDARRDKSNHLCVLENYCGHGTHIPIFNGTVAVPERLDEAAEWIESHRPCLVHCGAGIERSPLTVTWWLYRKRGMTLKDAWALVASKRPQAQNRFGWIPQYT